MKWQVALQTTHWAFTHCCGRKWDQENRSFHRIMRLYHTCWDEDCDNIGDWDLSLFSILFQMLWRYFADLYNTIWFEAIFCQIAFEYALCMIFWDSSIKFSVSQKGAHWLSEVIFIILSVQNLTENFSFYLVRKRSFYVYVEIM